VGGNQGYWAFDKRRGLKTHSGGRKPRERQAIEKKGKRRKRRKMIDLKRGREH